jgi:menaquinone-dependent protoporphyrinogen IX oxidase
VLLKKKPELAPYQFDPEIYDLIIIGTPVWAWSFAPPLRTFFNDHSLEDKKVALFITHQGGPGKTLANMETELPNARIIAKRDFHNEKDKISRSVSNARLWAASILK